MQSIVISGYYGFGNTGDEAVLAGIIATFRKIGLEAELTVLSADPERTKREHPGVNAIHRMKPAQVIRAMRRADLVISGGGSLFQDVTSAMSLHYYLSVLRLARILKRKTMIYAQGVGPLIRPGARNAVARAMNRADLVTVRDSDSKALLESIGVTGPVHLGADPSFVVEPDLEAADELLEEHCIKGREFIAVGLRNWPALQTQVMAAGEGIGDAARSMDVELAYLPMQEPEDVYVAPSVAKHLTPAIIRGIGNPSLAKGLIARSSLVVGMRLHCLIFAAGVSVPFVPVVYDPKVASFASSVGFGPGAHLDTLTTGSVRDAVTDAWVRRTELAASLADRTGVLKEMALSSGRLAMGLLESTGTYGSLS